ncbi:MAG: metallophosphoesterase family protein [Fusobacteriaceae bacterium]
MKIAVISDIHSNIYSLKAVLKDIEKNKIKQIYCTGDLVGYHTHPNEVIELIKKNKIKCVLGNHDLKAIIGKKINLSNIDKNDIKKAIITNYTLENISFESTQFLKSLPKELVIRISGKKIKLVHGSPRAIDEYLEENSEVAVEIMKNLESDILICGHTHKAYYKYYDKKILINAGSIGKPKKGFPQSEYIILDFTSNKVFISIQNVDYDIESIIKDIENSELPNDLGTLLRLGGINEKKNN